jgi:hypothetical protein
MKVFPTCLFAPNDFQADLERRTISGGESLSGDEDLIATDGGGRVFVEIADTFLDDPEPALAWRALDAYCDGGVRAIIVPFCDGRHQPTNGSASVPHSDLATFSDEAEYSQGDASGEVAADAALRATVLVLSGLIMPRALLGGEWLSIDHPTMRWRAYRIAEILEQDTEAGTAMVSIRPPLREAVTAGESVDFAKPRCVMRPDGGLPSPTNMGYASGSARFVEDFSGNYD